MSELRIGSIMKFDSTKSRKEAYNCGRKKGALEELEKLGKFIDDWYSAIDGERLTEYYAKRLKEKGRC
jgi:hypothetical protein